MYTFRVYIYLIREPFGACQKSYGFKNLVKLEVWQTNFKITIGTCVFKKSSSTSILAGMGALFDKFHKFFCSKSRACHLASLPSQPHKPRKPCEPRNQTSQTLQASQPSLASLASLASKLRKSRKPRKQASQTSQARLASLASLASKQLTNQPTS